MPMSTMRNNLLGAWRLVSYIETNISTGAKRYPMGEQTNGILIYSHDGYMSSQIQAGGRAKYASGDMFTGTPDEYVAAGRTFLSYTGRFHLDEQGGRMRHEMLISSFPNWVDQTQVRLVRYGDDVLSLSYEEPQLSNGEMMIAELIWKRAAPNT